MPQQTLAQNEVLNLLAGEIVVRVAFSDPEFPYVIPLGYVYAGSTLYGITAPGRKTRLAESNPQVGFQLDNSDKTGPWEWRSVTGEGRFELVKSEEEQQRALSALEPLIAQAPSWWQEEIRPLVAARIVRVWKITPTRVSGVQYVRP